MKPKKPKPLTHAEFSARGGKANTPAQNAARADNSRKAAADKRKISVYKVDAFNDKPADQKPETK